MPRKLFLHVGLPKTATSSLQRWFHVNRAALLAQGVHYPRPESAHSDKHDALVGLLRRPAAPAAFERFLATGSEAPNLLLSHEGLSNHLSDLDAASLAAFRERTAGMETTVLLATRPEAAWLPSYYRQCVINPANGASDLWGTSLRIEQIRRHPRIEALLDHDILARDLKQAFGAARVVRLALDRPGWFATLLQETGLTALADRPLERVNEALPDWVIDFLREVNETGPAPADRLDWLALLGRHVGGAHPAFDEARRQAAGVRPPPPFPPAALHRLDTDPALAAFHRFCATAHAGKGRT